MIRGLPGASRPAPCNTTDADAGLLNAFIAGGFERQMPAIVDWFAKSR